MGYFTIIFFLLRDIVCIVFLSMVFSSIMSCALFFHDTTKTTLNIILEKDKPFKLNSTHTVAKLLVIVKSKKIFDNLWTQIFFIQI